MFVQSGKGLSQLWLQDGDPSQNRKAACEAMGRCHSELLQIPPQSPDLNPIKPCLQEVRKRQSSTRHFS